MPFFSLFLTQINLTMKKYAALLMFALFLNGCDDGDLTVDTIDFSTITPQSCDPTISTLIYKTKQQEALLLQLPEGALRNENENYTYNIDNSGYRVVYRAYDGNVVASTNLCGLIPPSTPKVTEEWIGTNGVIEIKSAQVTNAVSATNDGTRIVGYEHTIVFKNITFAKPQEQTQPELKFGVYRSTVTPADLTFLVTPNNSAYLCDNIKGVFNYNNSFYLSIENIDPDLIKNVATGDTPRTSVITADQNKVFYKTADTSGGSFFTQNSICSKSTSPTIKETWTGQAGVDGKGIIEVTTTFAANVYTHTIVLKRVTLEKGKSNFYLGTSFVLGTIETK